MNVNEFCNIHNITKEQFYGKEIINGSLQVDTELPIGFNPTLIHNLIINSKEINYDFHPIMYSGKLQLPNITKLTHKFEPIVSDDLYLIKLNELDANLFKPIIGGDLYLSELSKLPNDFEISVGKSLIMPKIVKIPSTCKITIGYNLELARCNYYNIESFTNIKIGRYISYKNNTTFIGNCYNSNIIELSDQYVSINSLVFKIENFELLTDKKYYIISDIIFTNKSYHLIYDKDCIGLSDNKVSALIEYKNSLTNFKNIK